MQPEPDPLPDKYSTKIVRTPLADDLRAQIVGFLGHKDDVYVDDINLRLQAAAADLVGLALWKDRPVAHACLARSYASKDVALLCHVFTAETHRTQGLATTILQQLFATFDEEHGRWAVLGVSNPAAERIYKRMGFRGLNGGLDEENFIMCRTAPHVEPRDVLDGTANGKVVPMERRHLAELVLLLNLEARAGKLPAADIDRGLLAEKKLVKLMHAQDENEARCRVLVAGKSRRVRGIGCSVGGKYSFYAPDVPQAERDRLIRAVEGNK